jgi:histidyl-tRNA synthetase
VIGLLIGLRGPRAESASSRGRRPLRFLAVFQALPGFRDLLPPETDRWRELVRIFGELAARSGYGEVIPPVLEDLGVFHRLGEATDVVTKEMYDFADKGDRHVALRPEFTAQVARMFIEHHPTTPWKVWCWGPAFRYEKPQAGRYRQFAQLGIEAIGTTDPGVDVEVIAVAHDLYRELGLRDFTLKINSLGDESTRGPYLAALRAHFAAHLGDLSTQSRVTLEKNPLRVLDSKRAEDQEIIARAPHMVDFLTDELGTHFAAVQTGLSACAIPYEVDPRLVRGLDYYTHTLFEFASHAMEGSQNAIGGGGHYDNLVEQLGGPSTPGIGFGLGVDRILLACDAEGVFDASSTQRRLDAYVVDTTGGAEAVGLCAALRRAGLRVDRGFDGRSMKSQMKTADRSGARFAIIVGSREVEAGVVGLRDLSTGEQREVPREALAAALAPGGDASHATGRA